MIDWGMVVGLALAAAITAILWWLAHRVRRRPTEEGL